MARTIAVIKAQILASVAADSDLAVLTSQSQTAYWRLWCYIQAVAINLFEQIIDLFTIEIETLIASNVPATVPWIRAEVLLFQYSAANPQVVQINDDFSVGYATVDETLQIISNCAVVPKNNGQIDIKVATDSPPTQLSAPQVVALSAYIDDILPAGALYNVVNAAADTLRIDGTIYYNGQYNGTIQADVEAALAIFMASLPFNGVIKVTDIIQALLDVAGVTDVNLSQITVVGDNGVTTNLILASTEVVRSVQTYSGYVIEDVGNPFSTTITYAVANV